MQIHKKFLNACKKRNKKLVELGYANYGEYLASSHWRQRRAAYAALHPALCAYCGNPADHLHHVSYDRIGAELDTDLQWLCAAHHEELHQWGTIEPPTDRQRQQLLAWGVPEKVIAGLTRGTAYPLINLIYHGAPIPKAAA